MRAAVLGRVEAVRALAATADEPPGVVGTAGRALLDRSSCAANRDDELTEPGRSSPRGGGGGRAAAWGVRGLGGGWTAGASMGPVTARAPHRATYSDDIS